MIAYDPLRVPLVFRLSGRAAAEHHLWRTDLAWQVMRGWYDDVIDMLLIP